MREMTMGEFTPTHPHSSGKSDVSGTDFSAVFDYTQEVILRHSRHQAAQWPDVHYNSLTASVRPMFTNCIHCHTVSPKPPLVPPGLEYVVDPGGSTSTELSVWNTSLYGNETVAFNETWSGRNSSSGGSIVELTAGHLFQDVALGILLGSLSMLTFVGNAMVLHAVRTEKRLQTVSNMFIISLAIADLIVGLIVMPISVIYIFTEEWLFGVVICQFWIGVDYTASTASILNLFILSLDRYWSVTSPLRYIRKRTKKRALIMISLVWFVSSLWLIPIIGWHHFEYGGVRTVPPNVCDTEYATNTALKIVTGILNFYLPLAIMYGLYGKIFLEIRKRSKFELGQRTAGSTNMKEVNNMQGGSSMTEDSDHRSNCESEHVQEPYSPYVSSSEQRKFLNPRGMTTTEYETETGSEDEYAKLHRGKYTNLTLVRVAADEAKERQACQTNSGPQSDIEIKVEYFYDEAVDNENREMGHRPGEDNLIRNHRGTAETSLSSPTQTSGCLTYDDDSGIASQTGRNSHYTKQVTRPQSKRQMPPVRKKHNHSRDGGNNQRPVLPSLGRILHIRHRFGGNREARRGESTLHRQAMKWHQRWFRQQTKKPQQCVNQRVPQKHKNNNPKTKAKRGKKVIRPSAALAKEIKAARQLGVIMGAFTLCFCPYFVLFMVVAFCDGCISNGLMSTMTWIGYFNSTMNPFLYPLCNMQFRRKFRKMLHLKTADDRVVANPTNSRYFTPRTSIAAYESRCHDY